jgi:hypothetical protein
MDEAIAQNAFPASISPPGISEHTDRVKFHSDSKIFFCIELVGDPMHTHRFK